MKSVYGKTMTKRVPDKEIVGAIEQILQKRRFIESQKEMHRKVINILIEEGKECGVSAERMRIVGINSGKINIDIYYIIYNSAIYINYFTNN